MVYKMDANDWKILYAMRDHGASSSSRIAKRTLLPRSTIHHRIQRMKKEGIITKTTIEIDYAKIQRSFLAYVMVSANLQHLKARKKTQYDLAQELKKFPFVERVDIVSGSTDLVVMIRTRDVEEFDKVLLGKIQLLEGIAQTQSLIVIHRN